MGTLAVLYTNMTICAGFSGVAETFILDVAICHYMFSYKITSIISEQRNMYALREKNDQSLHVGVDEITKFLGLLLISGYHRLPSEDDYWSVSEDLQAPIFSKVMNRERFRSIKKYMRIADNNQLLPSKVAKVLPLLNKLKQQCQQFGMFHEFLSIYEFMVPYRGFHSAKQFITNKPVSLCEIWLQDLDDVKLKWISL